MDLSASSAVGFQISIRWKLCSTTSKKCRRRTCALVPLFFLRTRYSRLGYLTLLAPCSYFCVVSSLKVKITPSLVSVGPDQSSHVDGRDAVLWGHVPGYIGPNVKKVFHAMAVDETLDVFRPTRIMPAPHRYLFHNSGPGTEMKEVWFSGECI